MTSELDTVAELYDSAPEREWARLDERRIEFGITQRALQDFLPSAPAAVLDIGSGPGRYAIPLVSMGYSVSLLDLSGECLRLAELEASRAEVSFDRIERGSATALGSFGDTTFDAALLLGPLYHLKAESDRAKAVSEHFACFVREGSCSALSFPVTQSCGTRQRPARANSAAIPN